MKNIVIIGAGPAGLTAAYELLKQKTKDKIIILEESDQIGGISKTINYKGNRIDIGGHRFFTKNKLVNDIWNELLPIQSKPAIDDLILNTKKDLPKKGPDPLVEDKVFLKRNRVSRIFFENKFYDYPVSINLTTIKNLGFIRTIHCAFSYLSKRLRKKEENNLEDFYINRFGYKLYSMFFRDYTKKVWGRNPKEISKEWGYQRVKGISIKEVVKNYFYKVFNIKNSNKETSLIESFYYPKFGPGEMYEVMASKIEDMQGEILTGSRVVKITKKNKKITSITYIKEGVKYTKDVDILISSMPISDLISSMNNVPKAISKIASNLPYRDFITVGVLVDKLALKNTTKIKTINNNIPDCWLYIQDSKVHLSRIQIFNNWSPYMVKDFKNTVWLGLEYCCLENDSFWKMSDDKIKKYAIKELKKIKVIEKEPLDSCVIRVKKAYPAYFDSYKDIDKVKTYLNSIENLYCIGRNGQHHYNNMDHSMLTAILCADCIINNKNKDIIWNVNVDNNYHEEKNNEETN